MELLTYKYIPSLSIALVCIVFFSLPRFCFFAGCPLEDNLLYSFSHANIFHLAINLWALYKFRPRWYTCAVAYGVSVLCSFLPLASIGVPTCGLSAFLFACYARKIAGWQMSLYPVLFFNIILAFVPYMNWRIHLLAFFASFIYWYGYYYLRNRHIED